MSGGMSIGPSLGLESLAGGASGDALALYGVPLVLHGDFLTLRGGI
jgi:hypothetical protein